MVTHPSDNLISEITIIGASQLRGQVTVAGDKIVAVHALLMALVSKTCTTLINFPYCGDTITILEWAKKMGIAKMTYGIDRVEIEPEKQILDLTAIKHVRASICLVSCLTLRYGESRFSKPQGCSFTERPIDVHLALIERFGISIKESLNVYHSFRKTVPDVIDFNCSTSHGPSVGVTCHALIASLEFSGEIILLKAALEPAVQTLLHFVRMSSNRSIKVEKGNIFIGKIEDRYEKKINITLPTDATVAFTYIAAAIATCGDICIIGKLNFPTSIINLIKQMGIRYSQIGEDNRFVVEKLKHPEYVICTQWPGVPSDIGPILVAGLAPHEGTTKLVDLVYDHRSAHVNGLNKMGYQINEYANVVTVKGKKPNNNNIYLDALDIRTGAALMIGALARNGKTTISSYSQIFRGYPDFINSLRKLGGHIDGSITERNA